MRNITQHPTNITSDKYVYDEMLHKIADISNTTFRKHVLLKIYFKQAMFEKAKICQEIKVKKLKGCIADKALADT